MNNELFNHQKSDAVKWVCTLLAFLIVGVLIAGIICGWFDKKETPPAEQTETGFIVTPDEINGVSLSVKAMSANGNEVNAMAETSYMVTATIQPSTALQKADWSLSWKDGNSSWANGKTVTDYVTLSAEDGAVTATVTLVTTDVGQNQLWTTQFLKLNEHRKLLTSGGLGTMGFGLPAAIGAKLGNPDTPVVAVVGDGGFQMNIQELATAVINGLPVIICLLNNSWLGNVRQWQELYYGKRYQSTCLKRRSVCPKHCEGSDKCPPYVPDFEKLAESYGVAYRRITLKDQIDEAFSFALSQKNVPTLLEFMIAEEENVYPIVLPGKDLSTVKFGKEDS